METPSVFSAFGHMGFEGARVEKAIDASSL